MTAKKFYLKSIDYPMYLPICSFPLSIFMVLESSDILRFIGIIAFGIFMAGLVCGLPYAITALIYKIWMKNKKIDTIKKILLKFPVILLVVEFLFYLPIVFYFNDFRYSSYITNELRGFLLVIYITLGVGYFWIGLVFYIGHKLEKNEQKFTLNNSNELSHLPDKTPTTTI